MLNKEYDFVVIGGGLAGCFAAIAAARQGAKVALVDKQPYLGGNASPLLGVPPQGAMGMGFNRHSDETGLASELRDCVDRRGKRSGIIFAQVLWELTAHEKSLDCYTLFEAIETVMNGENEIASVQIKHVETDEQLILKASVFADCSGDGDMGAQAGAEFMLGREAKKTFNEPMAPDEADDGIMGASLNFTTKELPFPMPFVPPEGTPHFSDKDLPEHYHITGICWWLEYATAKNVFNQEELYKKHLELLFGFWDHLKNDGDHGLGNRVIDFIASDVSRRESRRFVGDHVLSECEITTGHNFEDAVAFGGWPIDIHPPNGILSGKPPAIQHFVEPYAIPYRSLYSKNIDNLLFAGRNASVSHVALGSTRIIWTCAVMGEAVGHAAALCIKYGCQPRDIHEKYITELQQNLLKSDCYIPCISNQDHGDKARETKVLVSSTEPLQVTKVDEFILLSDRPLAQTLPVSSDRIETICLYIKNISTENQMLNFRLFHCGSKVQTMFSSEVEIITVQHTVPGNHDGWLEIPLNVNTDSNALHWWRVDSSADLTIGLARCEIIGCQRGSCHDGSDEVKRYVGYHDDPKATWMPDIGTYAFKTIPIQYPFNGENIINGVAHPELWSNLWISDSAATMPQDVTIEFNESTTFSSARITFDAGLNLDRTKDTSREECVADYELWVSNAGVWKCIHCENGNDMRRRIHNFSAKISCDKFKLKILSTRGILSVRLYEIRLY